ncbi:MAG: UbiA family prenyltransferase [Parcubacteria group bacterium]
MFRKLQKFVEKIESYPLTIPKWILAFSSIIAVRVLGENLIGGFESKSPSFFLGSALVAFLFFLFSYLTILSFLLLYIKDNIAKFANILLWGFTLAVFPPLIDKIWCGTQKCWSFYAFDSFPGLIHRFFTFFGDNPTIGITYGVRVEVLLAVIFIGIYVYLKTERLVKAIIGAVLAYVILFILGSFPSWLTFVFHIFAKNLAAVQGYDIAALFLSPISYFSFLDSDFLNALNLKMNLVYAFLTIPALMLIIWLAYREKAREIAKNVRWIQISVHVGLILVGAGLGAFYFPANLKINIFSYFALANLILAAVLAWLASVFVNDIEDIEIDRVSNKARPLAKENVSVSEYRSLFLVSFILSLILALTVGVKFFLIILIYQVIGWVYSAWPFRLKRFPIIASFLSALALALLFISGFILLADGQNISELPARVFWLLIIAFTVSLPIKDLKDIEGDRKNEVWTIPVLLGESWSRFLIGLGIFISYSLSVIWLNAKILFLPAMILGAISFAVLQNKKISPRRVHIWIFGFLFLYVLLMGYLVFWPVVKFS